MPHQQRKSNEDGEFSADALTRAREAQERAAELNFDWPDAFGALAKLHEEARELETLLAGSGEAGRGEPPGSAHRSPAPAGAADAIREETGDLLFAAVNVSRLAGVEPAGALAEATEKFERRFRALLALARERGLDPLQASLPELDEIWESVKGDERR